MIMYGVIRMAFCVGYLALSFLSILCPILELSDFALKFNWKDYYLNSNLLTL